MTRPLPLRVVSLASLALVAPLACSGGGGGAGSSGEVVIYCSLDQVYSEPILRDFEKETGIRVRANYDLEAQKTVGLVNRILAERQNPQCDVYWNNEAMLTLLLEEKGALEPYVSKNAESIPAEFKDPGGLWTGLAARARVLLVNTGKMPVEKAPKSIRDVLRAEYRGDFAIARPLFGTTLTHASALFPAWGDESASKFFEVLKKNGAVVCEGNAQVMRIVAAGDVACGLTDTDDANVAKSEGKPVEIVYLDQEPGGLGTLVIPNTVMLLKDAPNLENGRKLVDYILSPGVEEKLAMSRSVQMPLHPDVPVPASVKTVAEILPMKIDWKAAARKKEKAVEVLTELFLGN